MTEQPVGLPDLSPKREKTAFVHKLIFMVPTPPKMLSPDGKDMALIVPYVTI
jgi:hypothetical protein